MTVDEMAELFNSNSDLPSADEFMEFQNVVTKRSLRPDIHAFLLLEELAPQKGDMVTAAEHDQVWLGVDVNTLAENATPEQIIDLFRCGVLYDDGVESLYMFA